MLELEWGFYPVQQLDNNDFIINDINPKKNLCL